MAYTSKDLFKGLVWSGLDKVGFVALQLILELILARLLLPKDYGVIGIVLVFISLAITFSEGGFSNALIHKQDRNETDYAAVFYFNMAIAVFIYVIIFFAAPYVEIFFKIPDLAAILRIVSISIILNASIMVHKVKLSAALDFKLQAKFSLLAVFLSGIIGVYLATENYGVWALVYQNLTMAFFNAVFLWVGYRWFPKELFSFTALKRLFSFGSKILASAIIQALYFNSYPVLIGRFLGTGNLGLYSKSTQFTQMPSSVLTTIVQRVLFPFFSSHQNNNEKIAELNQFYTTICCLFFFPLFFIMAAVAEPLVIILFSQTWSSMTPLFVLLCIAYSFYPLIVNNIMMFQVTNKTSLFLKIEILTKIIGVVILLLTIRKGIVALGYGILAQQIIQFFITSFFVQSVLRKKLWEQIKVVIPLVLLSLLIYVATKYIVFYLDVHIILKALIGILFSIVVYSLIYFAFYRRVYHQLLSMIKK